MLAAAFLFGGMASAHAAHDLVVGEHSGPASLPITGTGTYTVRLDNSDPNYTDTATEIELFYRYDKSLVSYAGVNFTEGSNGTCADDSENGVVSCSINDIPHVSSPNSTGSAIIEFRLYVHGNSLNDGSFTGGGTVSMLPEVEFTSLGDVVQGNNKERTTTTIQAGTDLGIELVSTPEDQVASGGLWEHKITVTNHGPLTANGVKATLPLPPGTEWVTSSLPNGCEIVGSGDVECTIDDDLPPTDQNNSAVVFSGIQSQVTAKSGTQNELSSLSLTASVTSNRTDQNTDNNSANSEATVLPGTDLILEMSVEPTGTVLAGEPRTISVTPLYTGDVPTSDSPPSFTVEIPAGLTVDEDTLTNPGWGTCAFSGGPPVTILTCDSWVDTDREAGYRQSMGEVSFQVTGDAGSTYKLPGNIQGDPNEEIKTNNDDFVEFNFEGPEIDIVITKSGPNVRDSALGKKWTKGSEVQYTVTLRNPSTSNVDYVGEVYFVEKPPAELAVTNITGPNGWDCSENVKSSGEWGCVRIYDEGSPFAKNSSQQFTVTATVETDNNTNIQNKVCRPELSYLGVTLAEDCELSAGFSSHPVAEGTDLSLEKTVDTGPADIKAGDWLEYSIELRNAGAVTDTGNVAAKNALMKDSLTRLVRSSDGGSFQITQIPTNWTCGNGSINGLDANDYLNSTSVDLRCGTSSFPACTSGSCPVVKFRIRPLGRDGSGADLERTNTAYISSDTPEGNYHNNLGEVSVNVKAKTDLEIEKSVTAWSKETGTELEYSITVNNIGKTSGANNVLVKDVLPLDVTYLRVEGAAPVPVCTGLDAGQTTTENERTLTCNWETFGINSRTFRVYVRPNHGWQGKELENNVYVNVEPGTETALSNTTEETNYGNNHASAKAEAGEAKFDLAIAKKDRTDPLMVGDEVVYEVRIDNFGPSVATKATIYDYLPIAGFAWLDEVEFWDVGNDGQTLSKIDNPASVGISCSKKPELNALGEGGEDKDDPTKLNWLWPTRAEAEEESINPDYINGVWEDSIAEDADIICNMGLLEEDQARVLTYKMKAVERGVYLNHAIVRAQEHIDRDGFTDSNWKNDAIQHRTTVRSLPEAELSKEVSHTPVNLMEPFSYTITVINTSLEERLYAPQVRDRLPENMELTGTPALVDGELISGDFACYELPEVDSNEVPELTVVSAAGHTTFACALGDGVAAGQSVVIEVPVRITGGTAEELINKAALHLDTDLEFDGPTDWDPEKPWEPNPVKEDEEPVDVVYSSISGFVYYDKNDNGVKDEGEDPIVDVEIRLVGTDLYGNPVAQRSMQTNAQGFYEFNNLAPGSYTVTEIHPAGWVDGQDNDLGDFESEGKTDDGTGSVGNDVFTDIDLPAATRGVNYNFGELKPLGGGEVAACISGFVYHDEDNDGVFGENEEPISGVQIVLRGPDGFERKAFTDASGAYSFCGLEPSTQYTITEKQPKGWRDGKDTKGTGIDEGDVSGNDSFTFTPQSGDNGENWNFGERKPIPAPVPVPVDSPLALLALILGMGWIGRRYHMRKHA